MNNSGIRSSPFIGKDIVMKGGKAGKLASLNRSWQTKVGTYRALGMAGIELTPSKSECDWTPLSP